MFCPWCSRRRTVATLGALCVVVISACTQTIAVPDTEERDGVLYAIGSDVPYTGVVQEQYPDSMSDVREGAVLSETTYVDGIRDGDQTEFHANGEVKLKRTFVAGVVEGVVRSWSETGQLLLEQEYSAGKAGGLSRTWYPDGVPASEATYLNGALHGRLTRWAENGQMVLQREYRNGFPHGPTKEWYPDGSPLVDGTNLEGHANGHYRRWYANGQLALEGEYFRGESLEIAMWDEDGNPLDVQPDILPGDTVGDSWRRRR